MKKTIYFVRHGESESNNGGIMRGAAAELTEKGKQQAEVIAERIERIGVEALLSSPYPRTRDTARAIAARIQLPIEESPLLIEWRRPSISQGKSSNDPEVWKFTDELLSGYAANPDYRHSDDESFSELRARASSALSLLEQHTASRICVVTHGIFMRAVFGTIVFGDAFTGAEFKSMFKNLQTSNTGITVAHFDDQKGWHVETWNDKTHLG